MHQVSCEDQQSRNEGKKAVVLKRTHEGCFLYSVLTRLSGDSESIGKLRNSEVQALTHSVNFSRQGKYLKIFKRCFRSFSLDRDTPIWRFFNVVINLVPYTNSKKEPRNSLLFKGIRSGMVELQDFKYYCIVQISEHIRISVEKG